MKNVFIAVVLILFQQSLTSIAYTGAALNDYQAIKTNTSRAVSVVHEPKLDLAWKNNGTAIGFTITNIRDYTDVAYTITYQRSPGVVEIISGIEQKDSNQTFFTSQDILLGTCSGNQCIYHTGVSQLQLEVTLLGTNLNPITLTQSL